MNSTENEMIVTASPANSVQANMPDISPASGNRDTEEQTAFRSSRFGKTFPCAVIFGVLFSFCLYNNEAGILYVPFMAGMLYLTHKVAGKLTGAPVRSGKYAWFLAVSLMALSVSICTTGSTALHALDTMLAAALFPLLLIEWFLPGRAWNLVTTIVQVIRTVFFPITRFPAPVSDGAALHRERTVRKTSSAQNPAVAARKRADRKSNALYALFGIILAIPLLLVVIALLMSADPVFSDLLGNFLHNFFIPHDFGDAVRATLLAVAAFWASYNIAAGLIEEQMKNDAEKNASIAGPSAALASSSTSAAQAATAATASATSPASPAGAIAFTLPFALVYLVFCLVQVRYLVFHGTLPDGMTYAEYAHQGFYQLLAVSILNLVILVVVRQFFRMNKVLRAVLVIISLCTFGMIAASAGRMVLYIEAYQLTFLRLFVLWFEVVLCVFLTAAIVKIVRPEAKVLRFCVVAGTVLYLAFAFAHPDYWIARYDLAAWKATAEAQGDSPDAGIGVENTDLVYDSDDPYELIGDHADYSYITGHLSADAVPAYADNVKLLARYRYDHAPYSPFLQEGETYYHYLRTFNFAEWRAGSILNLE